ncbi:Segregation and condensation protein A [uncultured archaeon]|nr:Segregation and condensation protein A [uncultured archaeon]
MARKKAGIGGESASAAPEEDAPRSGQKASRARANEEDTPFSGEEGIEDAGERHIDTTKLKEEDMRLEKLVEFPTWREMLLDLVASRKLDPWNIDLVEITTGYVERISKMEMLDLRVPANLILAAAILIRFKSDALRFEEEAQVVQEETYVEEDAAPETIPVLELRTRIPPKRMVTLDELLLAMEKVFDEQKKREEKAQKIEIPSVINIQLPEFSIEERMGEIYERVLAEKDSEGLATFSSILVEKNPLGVVMTLLPLLHLVQDGELSIFQEKFFGEIFIRVRENNHTEGDDKKEEAEEIHG